MLLAAKMRRLGRRAPTGPGVLNDLMAGKTVDTISETRSVSRMRVERILRAELRALSIRPARDYAKLQIRRLDPIVVKLAEKANAGDLAAVDRLMKILDRLDRYHSFAKPPAKADEPDERDDLAFDKKLADLVARAKEAKGEA